MNELMRDITKRQAVETTTRTVEPLSSIKKTLRQHYEQKRAHYGIDRPDFYDRDLRRLFSDATEFANNQSAAKFLKRIRRDVRRLVGGWTSSYQYTIDRVIEDMIARCNQLNLRLTTSEERAKLDFTVLLTVQTMNYLHGGRHRVAL